MLITPGALREYAGALLTLASELDRVPDEPHNPALPPRLDLLADELDISHAIIHNSPDVRGWARTSRITTLGFPGVHVEHTREVDWPETTDPTRWADGGGIQFTLWIFFRLRDDGPLHGSGCIQFWKGCIANGGAPEHIADNWYYAADRWDGMTGHQPAPGDEVGFMVSQGDARNHGLHTLPERSAVARVLFPENGKVIQRSGQVMLGKGRRSVPAAYTKLGDIWVLE